MSKHKRLRAEQAIAPFHAPHGTGKVINIPVGCRAEARRVISALARAFAATPTEIIPLPEKEYMSFRVPAKTIKSVRDLQEQARKGQTK